jgi:L-alanine-DL-glutamate epimerase-like enolase superfamily enzyme
VVDKLDLSGGVLPLSDAPGLGVELDASKMERYRLDSASIG